MSTPLYDIVQKLLKDFPLVLTLALDLDMFTDVCLILDLLYIGVLMESLPFIDRLASYHATDLWNP